MTDRRKQRHTAGWILVFLLGCDLALLFFTLFYRFGLYNTTGLAEAFETGGYYEERETAMEERFRDCLLSAGLPEDFLSFEDYRDAFLRSLRDQVYGRGGTAPELSGLSIAGDMERRLEEPGDITLSLKAQGGILRLSGELGEAFHEEGTVPGLAEWQEQRAEMEVVFPFLAACLFGLSALGSIFLYFLQKRRRKFWYRLGAALLFGSLLYGFLGGTVYLSAFRGGMPVLGEEAVMEPYRKSVVAAGLAIGGVGFLGAALSAAAGMVLRKAI